MGQPNSYSYHVRLGTPVAPSPLPHSSLVAPTEHAVSLCAPAITFIGLWMKVSSSSSSLLLGRRCFVAPFTVEDETTYLLSSASARIHLINLQLIRQGHLSLLLILQPSSIGEISQCCHCRHTVSILGSLLPIPKRLLSARRPLRSTTSPVFADSLDRLPAF